MLKHKIKTIKCIKTAEILLLASVIVLICAAYFWMLQRHFLDSQAIDFYLFYQSATLFLQHKNIYLGTSPGFVSHNPYLIGYIRNLNPPIFTILIAPLAKLKFITALRIWTSVSLMAMFAGLWVMKSELAWSLRRFAAIGIFILLSYPMMVMINAGQISAIYFLLLVLAWRNLRNQREIPAAILLGILLALKSFFGIFLIYYVCRQRWRAIAVMLLTFILVTAIAVTLAGADSLHSYFNMMRHISWYANTSNASLLGLAARVFGLHEENVVLYAWPELTKPLVICADLCVLMGLLKILQNSSSRFNDDLGFCACLIAMLLISPLGWAYYFILLALPVAIIAAAIQHKNSILDFYLLICSLVCLNFPVAVKAPGKIIDKAMIFGPSLLPCIGLILLFCLALRMRSTKITSARYLQVTFKSSIAEQWVIALALVVPAAVVFLKTFILLP